jgi:hypothetical protein
MGWAARGGGRRRGALVAWRCARVRPQPPAAPSPSVRTGPLRRCRHRGHTRGSRNKRAAALRPPPRAAARQAAAARRKTRAARAHPRSAAGAPPWAALRSSSLSICEAQGACWRRPRRGQHGRRRGSGPAVAASWWLSTACSGCQHTRPGVLLDQIISVSLINIQNAYTLLVTMCMVCGGNLPHERAARSTISQRRPHGAQSPCGQGRTRRRTQRAIARRAPQHSMRHAGDDPRSSAVTCTCAPSPRAAGGRGGVSNSPARPARTAAEGGEKRRGGALGTGCQQRWRPCQTSLSRRAAAARRVATCAQVDSAGPPPLAWSCSARRAASALATLSIRTKPYVRTPGHVDTRSTRPKRPKARSRASWHAVLPSKHS